MITGNEVNDIYELIKTPRKIGAVMKMPDDFTDSPTVFRFGDKFYMYYISISKNMNVSGYETHLAVSDDLIHWKYEKTILKRNDKNNWDSKQIAGYAAFFDANLFGSGELESIDGRYFISYLAGNSEGYEPDPLFMGLAYHDSPISEGITKLPLPILRPDDKDAREYETKTLYKSYMFRDSIGKSGHKYINAYNAKGYDDKERIYLAVSDDGLSWHRFLDTPVIDETSQGAWICGDPQILIHGDIYIMLYFRYDRGKTAYNTFAVSRDLKTWKKWQGRPLIESEYEYENVHAHKPWLIYNNGKMYHFYCACNKNRERFIALATN